MTARTNLIDKVFDRLEVKKRLPTEYTVRKDGSRKAKIAKYRCECKCGNVTDVRVDRLLSGATKSCGCLRVDTISEMSKRTSDGHKRTGGYAYCYDGSKITQLKGTISERSNTGHKGIHRLKNGKYQVSITIRKKAIYLGTRESEEDAIKLREFGVNTYHKPIIQAYGNALGNILSISMIPPSLQEGYTESEIIDNYKKFLGME